MSEILVLLESSKWVSVPIPAGTPPEAVVTYVKLHLANVTAIPPIMQRLTISGPAKPDAFSLPLKLVLSERQNRTPTQFVKFYHNGSSVPFSCQVAPDDTCLDIKFLLAVQANCPPHYIRICVGGYETKDSDILLDVLLSKNRVVENIFIFLKFVYRDVNGDMIHRGAPHLVQYKDMELGSTLQRMVQLAAPRYSKQKCLGKKVGEEFQWITFEQAAMRITNLASGLAAKTGLKKGDRVGIWSVNRPEWVISDLACQLIGCVSVPLYDTLGPDACEYVINHAEVKVLLYQKIHQKEAFRLLKSCEFLESVYSLDLEEKVDCISNLESIGVNHRLPEVEVLPTDLCSICYTSGTTGNPKGVLLTHANVCSAITSLYSTCHPDLIKKRLPIFSYLPAAHIYGRVIDLFSFTAGNPLGFYSGDTTKLLEDAIALRPGYFPGVPRVWQKVFDKVNLGVNEGGFVKKTLFNYAFQSKQAQIREGDLSESIWDKLVFNKVKDKIGGEVVLMSSGAAPLSAKVGEFLKVCFKTSFAEGYGLTETSAVSCVTSFHGNTFGIVGTPSSSAEIKLVSVPSMDYLVTDKPCPRGEIWIRGPGVFQGYFKNPEKTAEVLTKDGWFKTGDIGTWRLDGNLQIIDRKKNIFKLSQGEYVRPEYIEGIYKFSPFVANCFVYGDSFQRYVVGIIVPDFETLVPWAKSQNLKTVVPEELVKLPEVEKMILADIRRIGVEEKLQGFEQVVRITLTHEDFTEENGLLTPSFKLKRHQAKLRFKNAIDTMYASLNVSKL